MKPMDRAKKIIRVNNIFSFKSHFIKRKGKPTQRVNLPSFACESNLLF